MGGVRCVEGVEECVGRGGGVVRGVEGCGRGRGVWWEEWRCLGRVGGSVVGRVEGCGRDGGVW